MSDRTEKLYTGLAASRTIRLGVADLVEGLGATHLWVLLGWQDIRQRYRRSVLGPFWLTISTAVMIAAMGFLYAKIFNQELANYLPFLAIGLIVWLLLSTVINESCVVFIGADQMIKQVRLPLTTHVCRMLWRNVIIFAHNAVIIVGVAIIYSQPSVSGILFSIVGLAGIVLNCLWIGLLLGVLAARFRDIPPIIGSLVQIAFFLTPILWPPNLLRSRVWLAEINPFFHLIQVVRGPILGEGPYFQSFALVYLAAVIGLLLTLIFFSRYRARVPYWL